MAVKFDDREESDGIYDDGHPSWRTNMDDGDEGDDSEQPSDAPPAGEDSSEASSDGRNAKKLSPSELSEAEGEAGGTAAVGASAGAASEAGALSDRVGKGFKSEALTGFRGRFADTAKRFAKKKWLVGAGLGGPFLLVIIIGLIWISSMKTVHFTTVMMHSTFQTLNTQIKQRATQNLFDSATMEAGATGSLQLQGRSLIDRLRGINPEKQLEQLGREGKIKFDIESGRDWTLRSTNEFKGVTIGNKKISLDQITKDLGYGDSYADISGLRNVAKVRERMTVRKAFVDQVKTSVTDDLAIEKRAVRTSVYDGIRQASDIPFSRWRQAGRGFLGKTPDEAYIENQRESLREVSGQERVTTASDSTNEAIDDVTTEIEKQIENGEQVDPAKAVTDAVKKSDVGGLGSLEKVSEKVATGVVIATLACMFHEAFNKLDAATEQAQDRAKRDGHQAATTRAEILYGDVTANAVQAEDRTYDKSELSPDYLYDVGYANPPIPDDYNEPTANPRIDMSNPILRIIDAITTPSNYVGLGLPGVGSIPGVSSLKDLIDQGVCKFILSPQGQLALLAGDFGLKVAATVFGPEGVAGEDALGAAIVKGIIGELKNTAAGIFSKSGALQVAGFGALDLGLQAIVGFMSPASFSGASTGPLKYSEQRVGQLYLAQENERQGLYGKPIPFDQANTIRANINKEERGELSQMGWKERYFSITNPYSLVGHLAAVTPASFTGGLATLQSSITGIANILNPLKLAAFNGNVLTLANSGTMQNIAYAQEASSDSSFYYHNVEQWGFSPDEIDKLNNDPSYTLEANAKIVEGNPTHYQHIDDNVSQCFTTKKTIDIENATIPGYWTQDDNWVAPPPPPHPPYFWLNKKELHFCENAYLSRDDIFRYRIYKGIDSYTVKMLEDQFNDAPASSTNPSTAPAGATDGDMQGPCAAGTTDVGIQDGYQAGNLVKVRLCALPNLPSSSAESTPGSGFYVEGADGHALVAAPASANFFNMVNAAKAAGIPMSATSSFRTMTHQQSLCDNNAACRAGNHGAVAEPGYSNHQQGKAIDFVIPSKHNTTSACVNVNGVCSAPGDPVWEWLKANSATYNLYQYSGEFWHFSTDGH